MARKQSFIFSLTLAALSSGALAAPPVGEEHVDLAAKVGELSHVGPGESVRVREFPVGPNLREAVNLTRFDIYAPGAKVYVVDGGAVREVPRSKAIFFHGSIEGVVGSRLYVSVEPESGAVRSLISSDLGLTEIRAPRARGGKHTVAAAERDGMAYRCAGEEPGNAAVLTPIGTSGRNALAGSVATVEPAPSIEAAATTALYSAVIGVDTDTELLSWKFGNSTTDATTYIANLFAAMNVMYERDLKVRLLQGPTFLRTGTNDPYSISGGVEQIREFADYWQANYSNRQRAVAVMLSGKGGSAYSASGLGYIDVLCNPYGYAYALVNAFHSDYLSGDSLVLGHEIGHNFGSPHTHCYSPPIDTCWSGEGGSCYTGGTSCPAGGGTVMSYCNMAGCGTNSLSFHQRTIDLVNPLVQAALGRCVSRLAATCGVKGDVNGDGTVNVNDALRLINSLYGGSPSPECSGNVNGDSKTDASDVLFLINYLFAGGPAPI